MSIRIVSWNVNGIRARLRHGHLQHFISNIKTPIDILCLQETKAESTQVKLPIDIQAQFPHRYWRSTHGTTQRKGLSGTSIWSSIKPIREIEPPKFDEEGRITAVEFPDFNVASIYTPTTGSSPKRFQYRTQLWHREFGQFLQDIKSNGKPTIVCGDLNTCVLDHDVYDPIQLRNAIPGFFDIERHQLVDYLKLGYRDAFRELYPDLQGQFTWWNPRNPEMFANNLGLRLDYFLLSQFASRCTIRNCEMLRHTRGSDHCPIVLDFEIGKEVIEEIELDELNEQEELSESNKQINSM